MAVFESDEIGTGVRRPSHRVEFEQAIVPVVDNGAESDSAADRGNMAVKPFLLRLNQILRQDENSVGARLLRPPRKFDRQGRAISDAGDNRRPAAGGFDRGSDDALVLGQFQGKELSGSTRGEQGGGIVADKIVDVLPVWARREREIVGEMRDRKGQQSRPDICLQTLR